LPGAVHLTAGSLADRLAELPRDRPIATICASGYRASVAASLLRAAGFEDVVSVAQGVPAWDAAGYPTEHGADDATGESSTIAGLGDGTLDHTAPHRH
jgi:hydroxyacylglutathione hydrolase